MANGREDQARREPADEASGKPTLRTIAEITGLAVTTVSRALGGAPQIALETRQRLAYASGSASETPPTLFPGAISTAR